MTTPFDRDAFISIARDLIAATDAILKSVVARTDRAAQDIASKIRDISFLSEEQSRVVKEVITSIYEDGSAENSEVAGLCDATNSMVDKIFESARSGDFETAAKIGESEDYRRLTRQTRGLARKLESLCHTDEYIGSVLEPVITALQFQDYVRQSLENLIWSFHEFFQKMEALPERQPPGESALAFWTVVEKHFTHAQDRKLIRDVVHGPNARDEDVLDDTRDVIFF